MHVAFFDLEKTISRDAVELTVAKVLWRNGESGKGAWRVMALAAWLYFKYELGLVSDFAVLKKAGAKAFRGTDIQRNVELYLKIYAERLRDTVYPEARERIIAFQRDGFAVSIVSATYRFMVEPFAEDLGIEHFVGQELELDGGICTGRLDGPVWHGANKAKYVRTFAAEHGCDLAECWAFGDSWNDLDMLEAVGHPVAVNPGRKLKKLARERGWEIARWDLNIP